MFKGIKRLSAVVLGLSFIFTACSPNQSKTETNKSAESNTNAPVTIRFAHGWSQSGDTAVAAEFVTKFANEHKDSVNLV